jgi:hypothetical protein
MRDPAARVPAAVFEVPLDHWGLTRGRASHGRREANLLADLDSARRRVRAHPELIEGCDLHRHRAPRGELRRLSVALGTQEARVAVLHVEDGRAFREGRRAGRVVAGQLHRARRPRDRERAELVRVDVRRVQHPIERIARDRHLLGRPGEEVWARLYVRLAELRDGERDGVAPRGLDA